VIAQRDGEARDGEDVVHRPGLYHPERALRFAVLPHLRALAVALVALALLCAGAPGFDFLPATIRTPESIEREVRGSPAWVRPLHRAALQLEVGVREPLAKRLQPVERFFRIAQSWHLYRNGPGRVARLEIWADGVLLHRSLDDAHAWLEPVLRCRRLRPVAEAVVRADGGRSEDGFTRFVVARVLAERPETKRVELRAVWSPWPGDEPTFHHAFVAEAPDWTIVRR
jgi:hypothetical protein